MPGYHVEADLDQPIIFRTVNEDVYKSSLETGSIWLRSSHYYRNIEDKARADKSEGVNGTQHGFPLEFMSNSGPRVSIQGNGTIGCEIIPHYIISMHGTSLTEEIRLGFGGFTIGIKNITSLCCEVVYQVSKQLPVTYFRWGPVSYQRTALTVSNNMNNVAINMGGTPPVGLKSINTDVLRKDPIKPFILQDEWRIAIFTQNYLNNDYDEPLKINVNTNNFYAYIDPQ